jgi:hypothetical protein
MALRIALFIQTLGAEPAALEGTDFKAHLTRLERQYADLRQAVGPEATRVARIFARAEIRTEGFSIATAGLVSPVPPTPTKVTARKIATKQKAPISEAAEGNSVCAAGPRQSKRRIKREKMEAFFARPDQTVLKCPKCRMRCGLPKKSWPAVEMAEHAKKRGGGGRDLVPYECSYQPGYWHLGHSRSKK